MVEGCTFHNTNDVPPVHETNGGATNVVNSRGIYTGYGDPQQHIHVRDSDFRLTDSNTCSSPNDYNYCTASVAVPDDHDTYGELTEVHFHDSCEIVGRTIGDYVIVDSGVGNDPDTSVPDGVPTTPEEAASGGGGGTDPVQVQEDFSHADVPGTYDLDTGSFTTTTTRSTSDEYALRADDSADGGSLVLRDDVEATAGNTYTLDAYFPSGSDNDAGVLFGARSGATSWSDYTGYMAFFDFNDDQIRVDYWENGSPVSLSSTAVSWPTGSG